VALSIVIAAPFAIFLYLGRQGPASFLLAMAVITVLVVGLMLYVTLAGRRMSYEVGQDALRINFSPMGLRIPYPMIRGLRRTQLTLTLRLFGGSWPGLHWGLFTARGTGRVYVYSTRMRGDFVLVDLLDGKKVAISPEEPGRFMEEMGSHERLFGSASPTDIRKYGGLGKAVYAQVMIVAAAFVLFMGYFFEVYPSLPDVVPVHFDLGWRPDRWAPKSELLLLLGVAALFPLINAILSLKLGKYGSGLVLFLGAIFIFAIAVFWGVIVAVQGTI